MSEKVEELTPELTHPSSSIIFYDEHNKKIGSFFENNEGKLDFEGNPTESAKIFIRNVLELYRRR